jgi:GNAT superfamily N-acetyltransferase
MEGVLIRAATVADAPLVLRMICELAEYERLAAQVVASEGDVSRLLGADSPRAEVLLAYYGDAPAGFALYCFTISTFRACRGLHLEDLYVRPQFRRKGIGRKLMQALARVAGDRHCGFMEWRVLDWNRTAIDFYEALAATRLPDWTVYRLDAARIHDLAQDAGD